MGRVSQTDVETTLSVQDLASIFKSTAQSMYGIGGRLGGIRSGQGQFNFFTPKDDVFGGLDDDPCAFEVGAYIPTFSGSDGGAVVLHMYVWERDDHREVRLATPHGLIAGAGKSKRRLRRLADAIQSSDPQARIASG